MKALTFIEYWNNTVESEIWQEMDSDEKNDFYDNAKKYNIFVSQQFRPEMIEELFEGFVPQRTGYIFDKKVIQLDCRLPHYYFITESYESYNVRQSYFVLPKNLNDFISDCSRAGLELEWKEGVWE